MSKHPARAARLHSAAGPTTSSIRSGIWSALAPQGFDPLDRGL